MYLKWYLWNIILGYNSSDRILTKNFFLKFYDLNNFEIKIKW